MSGSAAEARLRTRVWAGGSRKSICFTMTAAIGVMEDMPMAVNWSGVGVRSAEK